MVRILMQNRSLSQLNRRTVLSALSTAIAAPLGGWPVAAQPSQSRSLRLRETGLRLRDQRDTLVWRFDPDPAASWPLRRGETLRLDAVNDSTAALHLNWYGLNGVAEAEPLIGRAPIAAGQSATIALPLRAAGTYLLDSRIGNDAANRPLPCAAFAVQEATPPAVDRDDILLIEDWRVGPDGVALVPGQNAADAVTIFTVNGRLDWRIPARSNQRLRVRFVNGCHRAAIALRIENHDVRVIAIDGQPAEPFPARDGRLILAAGSRIDVLLDAVHAPGSAARIMLHDGVTAPVQIATFAYGNEAPVRNETMPIAGALPDNGLPAQIPLQNAQRFELSVGLPPSERDWVLADRFTKQLAPAFRARRGRAVVLALTNRAAMPVTLHLHGHHFRLLDRLDDGWKPFWLDTLLLDPGQTQRIAFVAEHPGAWLIEAMGIDWSAPRLFRWFAVE